MNTSFSISETLSTAWDVAKKNAWIVMGFTAVQFVVMFVFTTIIAFFLNETSATGALIQSNNLSFLNLVKLGKEVIPLLLIIILVTFSDKEFKYVSMLNVVIACYYLLFLNKNFNFIF
jgi:hypothetical protein